MPEDSPEPIFTRPLHNLPDSEKPPIRILLYTDDPQEVVETTGPPFGLGELISRLETHPPAFSRLSVKLVPRYPKGSSTASNKINTVLAEAETAKKPFDQVWFFGLHQINKKKFELGIGGGGPESELDKNEFEALKTRMDAGSLGVLVTGDHANQRPGDALDNPDSPIPDETRNARFLGLGRALGRCIPRAGMLRDWEGDPTANPRHSFNTQVLTFGTSLTQIGFQQDPVPQQLILKTFNERGKPSFEGRPHPLFFYKQGAAILLYPDHLHEGAVTLPKYLPEDVWPQKDGFQPKPRIVAHGVDKRNARRLKLIAVYDGDVVNAGRIVADSTWHHYFNVNLTGFPARSDPNTAADQIGQYYANLALWLSPRAKRSQMAKAMSLWLTRQPAIAELVGPEPSKRTSDVVVTGGIARKYLEEVASDCEVHELLQLLVPRSDGKRYESLYFPDESRTLSPVPSKELLLGSLIHKGPKESAHVLDLEAGGEVSFTAPAEAFATASAIAFKRQRRRVELAARRALRLFPGT